MSQIAPSRLSPEAEMLRLGAHPRPDAQTLARLQVLVGAPTLDWERLWRAAATHAVRSLLVTNLERMGLAGIPPDWQSRLLAYQRQNAWRNLYLTNQLVDLIRLLEQHGLQAMPYKGVALAALLYGQVGQRQIDDLDILTPPAEAVRARQLLEEEAGFRVVWPAAPLAPAQERAHLAAKYDFALERSADRLVVELHWSITPAYLNIPPRRDALWERLETMTLAGQMVYRFPAEELLLVLCVHGANHCWLKLQYVADVAALTLACPQLDWERVWRVAQSWHSRRILASGLCLSAEIFGSAHLPAAVLAWATADQMARRLAAQAQTRFRLESECWLAPLEEPLFHWRMRERRWDRWRYGAAMLQPTAKDWASLRLPPGLRFLYYGWRPVRLLFDHGWRLRQG